MAGLLSIELEQLRFRAFHGLYAEERALGNEFEVSLAVSYEPVSGTITSISDTVNYEALFELLKKEMKHPRHLLETWVMEVTELIHIAFPQIRKVEISIRKMQVPLTSFTGTAGVKYTREY